MKSDSTLTLSLFGAPTARLDNQEIRIGRRKAMALLAYLAVTQRRQSRAQLAALLWPAHDEVGARGELRRAISTLNQALGAAWLDTDRNSVTLRTGTALDVDVLTFREHLATGRTEPHKQLASLSAAVALVQADFLAGFALDDAPDFEEWQRFESGALQRELAWALRQLSTPGPNPDLTQCLTYAAKWLLLDPLDEAAHRRMMELHASNGDISAAFRQYQECKRLLAQELDAPPAAESTALYEQIRTGHFPAPAAVPIHAQDEPRATLPAPPLAQPLLPVHLTPFIGRTHELHELARMLASGDHRLVTITGPGGIGKTRLALQMARNQAEIQHWRDGVYFVELTTVDEGELLVSALAKGLNVTLAGGQPWLEQIIDYLRHKQMLIIFDNVEQLLTPAHAATLATFFDELLLRTAAITAIVTSRERLNLHGETVFNLLGMPFPARVEDAPESTAPTLQSYDAIRLFCQSAQRTDRAFQLTNANQAAVLQICQLVQGMPLAIDLAAAWVRMLTCNEIAEEIAQSIAFLTATTHNLPTRHRSMAAVFHHSWRLLSAAEQSAFAQLALFRGGCTRDAAQRVTGATLSLLSMLVDKSLVQRTQEGRFVIHELLRQFAAEQLTHLDATAAANRHATYYLELLARWEPAFLTHERMTAYRTLEPELDNIRHAWDWAVAQQNFAGLAQALQTLYTLYLEIVNNFDEGIQRFGQAIATVQQTLSTHRQKARLVDGAPGTVNPQRLVASLQARLAMFHLFTGKIEEAAALFAESLATLRAEEHQPEVAFVLTRYAMTRLWQGDLEGARALVEEGLALYRRLDVPGGLQAALTNFGYIAQQAGDFALAESLNRECLELLRISGDPDGLVTTLGNLGLNYVFKEEYAESLPYLEEALAISKTIGNRSRIAIALTNLMDVYVKVGRLAEARLYGAEALATFIDLGQRQYVAILESSMGTLELATADLRMHEHEQGGPSQMAVAEAHFYRSLQIANEIDVDLIRVYGVTGFGELLARRGEHARATALLTLAAEFPTTDPDITGRAKARLAQLATVLSAADYKRAQEHGRPRALAAVASELLAEFQAPIDQ